MKIKEAAKIMGIDAQILRCGLQNGVFPFGTAFKKHEDSRQLTYVIYDQKFREYCGGGETPAPAETPQKNEAPQTLREQFASRLQGRI